MSSPWDVWICVLLMFVFEPGAVFTDVTSCFPYNGSTVCYTISDQTMTWNDGFEYCRNLSSGAGVMASVYSKDVQEKLESVLENITDPIWIAGKTEEPKLLEKNTVSQWRWVYDCDKCDTLTKLPENAIASQGCYKDHATYPDLDVVVDSSGSNVSFCQNACSQYNYQYGGLQFDQKCSCGHDYGKYGTLDGCTLECGGNCGGFGRNFIYRMKGQFASWAFDQPDNAKRSDGTEFCAASLLSYSFDPMYYAYFDEECAQLFPYICSFEHPCQATPGSGSFYNTTFGTCLYISNRTNRDTWHRARTACWDMGGDLVTLRNETQHSEILQKANDTLGNVKVYIGLYREAYVWRREYREVEMNYYNFALNQPNTINGSCLQINPAPSFTWTATSCTSTLNTLCYQGPDMDPPPTTAPATVTEPPVTTKDVINSTTTTTAVYNTTLIPPTKPEESTQETMDRTSIILISVLVPVGVVLIILLIVLLVRCCKNNESTIDPAARTENPVEKNKIDARLQATRPQSSKIGELDESYLDMGSTVNLIYETKDSAIPQWKHSFSTKDNQVPEESFPTPVRRISNELILIPDFTASGSEPVDGEYRYEKNSEVPSMTTYASISSLNELATVLQDITEDYGNNSQELHENNPPEFHGTNPPELHGIDSQEFYVDNFHGSNLSEASHAGNMAGSENFSIHLADGPDISSRGSNSPLLDEKTVGIVKHNSTGDEEQFHGQTAEHSDGRKMIEHKEETTTTKNYSYVRKVTRQNERRNDSINTNSPELPPVV